MISCLPSEFIKTRKSLYYGKKLQDIKLGISHIHLLYFNFQTKEILGNIKKKEKKKSQRKIKGRKDKMRKKSKKSTAPGIPRRSPIQVLTGLYVA